MLLIAHRGNLWGPSLNENKPDYVLHALDRGYDAEVDVWVTLNGAIWLGHDEPQYQINEDFFLRPGLWCHAKNLDALERLLLMGVHCFYHQNDNFTLTSRKFIWTFPGQMVGPRAVAVLKNGEETPRGVYGICSDDVGYR